MNSLPIDEVLPALREALATRHEAVLEAPPGAGKTTRVPLALLNEPWLAGQRILMLEPRRLAARAAAERLASELGEKVGETVGYRIRLDSKVGPNTRIEVVTEGILTRRLQDDPALEGVGLLIFDEFHERSLDADLALALSLNGRDLFRDEQPLKILLMSATLEGERLAGLLDDAPILRSEGRMFPVDVRWGRPFQPGEFIEPRLVQTIVEALNDESGSVLVFLPGQAEIRRVHQQLADAVGERSEVLLCPLHGELDLAAQRAAIEPAPPGKRKVVLATNIAETSLTIDGVRVVVDAGLARVPRFDPGSGMTRLDTQRISRASATQRAGRAGRLEPGVCYRLWSQDQHEQLAAYGSAEILQADLAGLALQLARWGVTPAQLVWLDVPPGAAYAQAQDLLERLGALTAKAGEDWKLTPTARRWPSCRPIRALPICCCAARPWGWRTWPATSPPCSASATSCAAAVPTCIAAWCCCPARSARPVAPRAGCSGLGSWPGSTAVICVGSRARRWRTRTIRAGWAPCWRWPIRIGSPSNAVPAVPSTGWPTAARRCSARPTA